MQWWQENVVAFFKAYGWKAALVVLATVVFLALLVLGVVTYLDIDLGAIFD